MLTLKRVVTWVVIVGAVSKVGVLLLAQNGGSQKRLFGAAAERPHTDCYCGCRTLCAEVLHMSEDS